MAKIIRNRAQCLNCGDVIESVYRHDMVWCSCGEIAVDGGKEYLKRSARNFDNLKELCIFGDKEEE